jgi:hypothetical protein
MKAKTRSFVYDGEEVERLRAVREQIAKEFKTPEALFAETLRLDALHRRRIAARRRRKKAPHSPGKSKRTA